MQEIATDNAHIESFGNITETFELAARIAYFNHVFSVTATGKSVQDRYENIQDTFDRTDVEERLILGIIEEVRELQDMLGRMAEACSSLEKEKL